MSLPPAAVVGEPVVVGVEAPAPDEDGLLLLPHAASASPPSATPAPMRKPRRLGTTFELHEMPLRICSCNSDHSANASFLTGKVAWCISSMSAAIDRSWASLISIGSCLSALT